MHAHIFMHKHSSTPSHKCKHAHKHFTVVLAKKAWDIWQCGCAAGSLGLLLYRWDSRQLANNYALADLTQLVMDWSCVGSMGIPALAGVSLTSIHYLFFYRSYIIKDCYICICRICLSLPVLQRFFTISYVLYVVHYYILVCSNKG